MENHQRSQLNHTVKNGSKWINFECTVKIPNLFVKTSSIRHNFGKYVYGRF